MLARLTFFYKRRSPNFRFPRSSVATVIFFVRSSEIEKYPAFPVTSSSQRRKFQDLASQETNRRWDGPIANSFRVEKPLSIQFIQSLYLILLLPHLLHLSPVLRLLVFFVSPFPAIYLPRPASVFKDLITDSSLILSSFLILSRPSGRLILCLSLSFFHGYVLAASSIGAGMRFFPFHGRETRLRKKGGVKGEGESTREDERVEMEKQRRRGGGG